MSLEPCWGSDSKSMNRERQKKKRRKEEVEKEKKTKKLRMVSLPTHAKNPRKEKRTDRQKKESGKVNPALGVPLPGRSGSKVG